MKAVLVRERSAKKERCACVFTSSISDGSTKISRGQLWLISNAGNSMDTGGYEFTIWKMVWFQRPDPICFGNRDRHGRDGGIARLQMRGQLRQSTRL